MIARTWTARATPQGAAEYMDKVRAEELPHFQTVPGYLGCRFMQREEDGAVEILVVTFWESMEAIKAFAGADATRAYLPPEVVATLDRYDEVVEHFAVAIDDPAPK